MSEAVQKADTVNLDSIQAECWEDWMPRDVYNEFKAIQSALPQLESAHSLRAACKEVAARIGTLTGSALYRRVREYLATKDQRALANRRKCSALWIAEPRKLPASFQEFVRALREKHGRVATAAYDELIQIWRTHYDAAGNYIEKIPGYAHWPKAHPVYGHPWGWSYENLQKVIKQDPYDDAAAKLGLAAANAFRPPILTTRVGLRLGERVEFDDHEFDVKIHFPGQSRATRPICFGGIDGLSSFAEIMTRPIFWDEETETRKKLTEFQFRCFVVHWLTTHGYRADAVGTTFFTEAGVSVIRESFAECLARETGGRVSVKQGRVFADRAHPGQYAPRGKGSPTHKPAIEGFWSVLENLLDRLPGRTGSNARLNGPAQLHGQEMVLARVLKLLPTLTPERAADMKIPLLPFHVFTQLAFAAMAAYLDDHDHALEGWDKLGFEKLVWRPAPDALGWHELEELTSLPECEQQLLVPRLNDPSLDLTRSQRLSRLDVWQRYRHELTRCRMQQYSRLFPPDDGFEVSVTKQRLIEFTDRTRFGPDEFRFKAWDDHRGDFLPGERFLAFFNPLNPQWLQLCNAKGNHVALVEAWESPSRNDVEGINKQIGKRAAWEAPRKHRLAARHFDEAEQRLHLLAHNEAIAAERNPAPEPAPASTRPVSADAFTSLPDVDKPSNASSALDDQEEALNQL